MGANIGRKSAKWIRKRLSQKVFDVLQKWQAGGTKGQGREVKLGL